MAVFSFAGCHTVPYVQTALQYQKYFSHIWSKSLSWETSNCRGNWGAPDPLWSWYLVILS